MAETTKGLSTAIGRAVDNYTWIILDILVFLLLVTLFLGYGDYDERTQGMLRGLLVFSMWIFSVSGLHILIYFRFTYGHKEPKEMPGWLSYSLFLLKPAIIACFFYWAEVKAYL